MRRYCVTLREDLYRYAEVEVEAATEADALDQAEEMAREAYDRIDWTETESDDLAALSLEEVEDEVDEEEDTAHE